MTIAVESFAQQNDIPKSRYSNMEVENCQNKNEIKEVVSIKTSIIHIGGVGIDSQ